MFLLSCGMFFLMQTKRAKDSCWLINQNTQKAMIIPNHHFEVKAVMIRKRLQKPSSHCPTHWNFDFSHFIIFSQPSFFELCKLLVFMNHEAVSILFSDLQLVVLGGSWGRFNAVFGTAARQQVGLFSITTYLHFCLTLVALRTLRPDIKLIHTSRAFIPCWKKWSTLGFRRRKNIRNAVWVICFQGVTVLINQTWMPSLCMLRVWSVWLVWLVGPVK